MTTMPNIEEIKSASGSDNLVTAFKFLFSSEVTEDRAFVIRMEGERQQLLRKIEKRDRTIMETHWFGPFDADAVDGLDGLVELQRVDRESLLALDTLIQSLRDGIAVREAQVGFMEINEQLSED